MKLPTLADTVRYILALDDNDTLTIGERKWKRNGRWMLGITKDTPSFPIRILDILAELGE